MLGGIVFQTGKLRWALKSRLLGDYSLPIVVIVVYSMCSGEFFFRYLKDRPIIGRPSVKIGRGVMYLKVKWMIGALLLSTLLLFIRWVSVWGFLPSLTPLTAFVLTELSTVSLNCPEDGMDQLLLRRFTSVRIYRFLGFPITKSGPFRYF